MEALFRCRADGGDALYGGAAKAEAIPDGGTFTVTWAQNPVSLNPGLSSGISSGIPGAQLFASPLQYDDQWNPHPYLAEKWEMAPDG